MKLELMEFDALARSLCKGGVLSWALKEDGSLTVVQANGQKVIFSAGEVLEAIANLNSVGAALQAQARKARKK